MANPDQNDEKKGSSVFGVIQSVLGAAFGVQSSKRHAEDAQIGRPAVYITAGVLFTLIFVITVAMVVRTVLSSAAG